MSKTAALWLRFRWLMALALLPWAAALAATDIPERPTPPRLVNDFAHLYGEAAQELEDSLEAFARATSNQIVIVTVDDLGDYTPNEFATEIGDRWGVGQKNKDNGIVLLIKPKAPFSDGRVYIATGRGLEGALPDAFCHRIIDDKMLPILRQDNDYTAATWAALKVIMPVCRGEYDYQAYQDDEDLGFWGWVVVIGILAVFFGVYLFWPFIGGGTFTSGGFGGGGYSGGSSGGFGGFGGFGGGSFGGGGAGGSW